MSKQNLNKRISGFHKLDPHKRRELVHLDDYLSIRLVDELGNRIIENYVGNFELPTGIVSGIKINNRNYLIPMCVEESSIIAGLNKVSKMIEERGSLKAQCLSKKIQGHAFFEITKAHALMQSELFAQESEILNTLNSKYKSLVRRGGGFEKLTFESLHVDGVEVLKLTLSLDPVDSMGANAITSACEIMGQLILKKIPGLEPVMGIVSNHLDEANVYAKVKVEFPDKAHAKRIVKANQIAALDISRAATHNKGILNGIDPILIATGNDWRANNACFYSYLQRKKKLIPTTWTYQDQNLIGEIALPVQLATAGGLTKLHPKVEKHISLMDIKSSQELAEVVAAIGLCQNLAALYALTSSGIIQGHMKLHCQNLASLYSQNAHEYKFLDRELKRILAQENKVTESDAQILIDQYRRTQGVLNV
jgi:hydroxymethylglutaryl-CoA reductase